ncbi:MAG: succinylglutamate desuccinylase/aspartoacylase family protein [Candidatus Methylomirabilales bacterium]
MSAFKIRDLSVEPGKTGFTMLPVTRTLRGDLALPVHVTHGSSPGPVLGVLGTVHGDESMPIYALREVKRTFDPRQLAGTLIIVPVTNPVAFAGFRRETEEQRENTDLHRAFPGSPSGSLTEMTAWTLGQHVFSQLTALVDLHSGGVGGRTQQRADLNEDATGALRERSFELCRAFGTGFVHVNFLPTSSAVGCANDRGIIAAGVELGGAYLPTQMMEVYSQMVLRGVTNLLKLLKMLPGEMELPPKQFLFTRKERKEANPTRGGYLISKADKLEDLGRRVRKDELLGTVVDPYTLEPSEDLRAPCDGLLFFSRMSGVVEAGAKGFAIADAAGLKEVP